MLATAAVSNDLVLSFIHEKVPKQPPLPDGFFENTPYIPSAFALSEYFMLTSFTIMLLITVFHKYRWIVLRFHFKISIK